MANQLKKEIILQETTGVARVAEYVRTGIPWAKGELYSTEHLTIQDNQGGLKPVQATVLTRWPDGSICWLLVDFACSVGANSRVSYFLIEHTGHPPLCHAPLVLRQKKTTWEIDTGPCVFVLDSTKFLPFLQVRREGIDLLSPTGSAFLLVDEHGQTLTPFTDEMTVEVSSGPLRTILMIQGHWGSPQQSSPRFSCRLHFISGSGCVLMEMRLHNPKAAKHPGGLWDLGDPGSSLFKECSLNLPLTQSIVSRIGCQPFQSSPVVWCDPAENLSIYQESSGGENWQSPVHRNRNGVVPLTFSGYELRIGDKSQRTAGRATPILWCGGAEQGVAAVVPFFWQEFPKSLAWDGKGIKISLFPAEFPDLHELQGGEQKTHSVLLDFATAPECLARSRKPVVTVATPHVFLEAGVFSDIPLPLNNNKPQNDLIDAICGGPEEFFRKREIVDEYGWRNFGDVYADHEAVFHQGPDIFVSHYNNQYDLCAGFYRKFLSTSDPRWGELANDLARHVLDIDIYHTTEDREEYNNGLFWHTDHYIDAGLSTHRSFSREHFKQKNPRFCGGGPGAEHCYTTGLAIHYWLTGDPHCQQAVTGLADWVILSLKGPQTILATFKRGVRYFNLWRAHRGNKKLFPRYPLTRGTGNAISACLDTFLVGGGRHYLNVCDDLIRGAIHPHDDIQSRNLLDAEVAWSYTVLLSAIAKVADIKYTLGELDAALNYAQRSVLAYGEWMAQHEYPYLDKPGVLEYPNETWAAQDLRKAVVLCHAARYANPKKGMLLWEKAHFFWNYGQNELARQRATSRFTRPLALVLQNDWAGSRLWNGPCRNYVAGEGVATKLTTPYLSLSAIVKRFTEELIETAHRTSLRREWVWLRSRMNIGQ